MLASNDELIRTAKETSYTALGLSVLALRRVIALHWRAREQGIMPALREEARISAKSLTNLFEPPRR